MFRQGIVKWYDPNKHFGFITEDGVENEDIFFHSSGILTLDQSIDNGTRVSFDVKNGAKGLEATNVKPLD